MKIFSQRGFTLVELMIVVAIVGILAAIAIPNFNRFKQKSKQAEVKTNLSTLKKLAQDAHDSAEPQSYINTVFTMWGWTIFADPLGGTFVRYNYHNGGVHLVAMPDNGCTSEGGETNATNFTIGALSNLDDDGTCDTWRITDTTAPANTLNDVTD